MPKESPLPARLKYLEPVRKQLAALAPDDIHEDTDLSVLRRVVRKRIKGLSSEEARTMMAGDAAELEKWLSMPQRKSEPLHFILPILPDAMDVLFAEAPRGPPERGVARMELPEGAKVTEENGCWSVKWRRVWLFLYPSHCEDMHTAAGRFRDNARSHPMIGNNGMSIAEVRFGSVTGIKCISMGASARFKRVDYALEVPGGCIIATQDTTTADFDEAAFEAYFHTLRVLNYPPAPS